MEQEEEEEVVVTILLFGNSLLNTPTGSALGVKEDEDANSGETLLHN